VAIITGASTRLAEEWKENSKYWFSLEKFIRKVIAAMVVPE
jgi:hypothetical protein